jgi:hypothetical protein
MEFNKKQKLIIVVLLFLLGIALVWFGLSQWQKIKQPTEGQLPTATSTKKTLQEQTLANAKNIQPRFNSQQVELVTAGRRFAERLGSFSRNTRDADPEKELLAITTPRGLKMSKDYYQQLTVSKEFYGSSASALKTTIVSEVNEQATMAVDILRKEFNYLGEQTKSYQATLKINLIKINDQWLVDGFIWQ